MTEEYRKLTREELNEIAGEELPERAAMSLINATIAAPPNAAVALHALSAGPAVRTPTAGRDTTIPSRHDIENAETEVLSPAEQDGHGPVEAPVTDDLPPARDGGVTDEGHRRAAAEAAASPTSRLAEGIELIG